MPDEIASVRLILAVLRAEGIDFETAWSVDVPSSRPDRHTVALRAALDETQDAWRRAFDRAPPTAGEQACALLFGYAIDDAAEDRAEVLASIHRVGESGPSGPEPPAPLM